MPIKITFVTHSTTLDNEAQCASGWNDAKLSDLGKQQALELGERQKNEHYDVIFTSDLSRAIDTATIAFKGRQIPILTDKRLRECDYGDLTCHPNSIVEPEKINRLHAPFPNGESYMQTNARMKAFLENLKQKYPNGKVLIIGHRATHYALDCFLKNIPMETLLSQKFIWQSAFYYEI